MIDALWGSFPRLLEQNINGLLDTAEPNAAKAFQLYKTCKNEDLWRDNFHEFSKVLRDFYARPRGSRRKSQFDRSLDRPMGAELFPAFALNFRTAVVDDRAVSDIASWAYNLIRISKKTLGAIVSLDVITETLRTVTTPGPLDKAENIEFDDFCGTWKRVVGRRYGATETAELSSLVGELQRLNDDHQELVEISGLIQLPLLQMTEPEMAWIKLVRLSALAHAKIPRPPVQQGHRKQALRELDRVIQLYELVLVTTIGELQKHRESTRLTLIDRCETLLAEAEPRAA